MEPIIPAPVAINASIIENEEVEDPYNNRSISLAIKDPEDLKDYYARKRNTMYEKE